MGNGDDMAKRRFELPGIQELSKDQDRVLELPKEGQHLVVGGPGTGKTIVALLRARRHQRDGDPYEFLVYNHLLKGASARLFGGELSGDTWMAWFFRRFHEITGQAPPKRPAPNLGGFEPIDWDGVAEIARGCDPVTDAPFLVIDEGQDMPPRFYHTLVHLGYERYFVAADQNQQLKEEHSSVQDIAAALAVEADDVIELKENYRNSTLVARLAAAFRTDDIASPPVDLPTRSGVPAVLFDYTPGRFADVCLRIAKLVDRDPSKLVGVIAPNNKVRDRYLRHLRSAALGVGTGGFRLQTFYGDYRPEVRWDEGGVLVINAQACKGLEFDVAVLADIDDHQAPDLDALKKRFYVMVSRARDQVLLIRRRGEVSAIDAILPTDVSVLRREELV